MFSSLSPESLADSLEASTRDEGHTEEAEKKGSQEGGGAAGARRRPEAGSDGSQPRVQVSLGEPVIPEGLQWLTNAAFARRAPELAVAALVRKPPSAPGCSAGGSFSRSVGPDALKTPGLEPKDERAQHLCVCVCVSSAKALSPLTSAVVPMAMCKQAGVFCSACRQVQFRGSGFEEEEEEEVC